MGPGFVILFWITLAALFGGVWFTFLFLFLIGLVRRKPILKWIGLVPLLLLTIGAFAVAGLVGWGIIRSMVPSSVYQDVFHERPTSEVHDIHSRTWSFADSAHVYLQFTAPSATVARLAGRKFTPATYRDLDTAGIIYSLDQNQDRPRWWLTMPTNATIYLCRPEYGKGSNFASETSAIIYDQKSGVAQYYFLGID